MTERSEEDLDRDLTQTFESREFKLGSELGAASAKYETFLEAKEFFDNGQIELWLEWHTPKSMEDWDIFYEKHPELRDRSRAKREEKA